MRRIGYEKRGFINLDKLDAVLPAEAAKSDVFRRLSQTAKRPALAVSRGVW